LGFVSPVWQGFSEYLPELWTVVPQTPPRRTHRLEASTSSVESTPEASEGRIEGLRLGLQSVDLGSSDETAAFPRSHSFVSSSITPRNDVFQFDYPDFADSFSSPSPEISNWFECSQTRHLTNLYVTKISPKNIRVSSFLFLDTALAQNALSLYISQLSHQLHSSSSFSKTSDSCIAQRYFHDVSVYINFIGSFRTFASISFIYPDLSFTFNPIYLSIFFHDMHILDVQTFTLLRSTSTFYVFLTFIFYIRRSKSPKYLAVTSCISVFFHLSHQCND